MPSPRRKPPFEYGERAFIARFPLDHRPAQFDLLRGPQEYKAVIVVIPGNMFSVVALADDPNGNYLTIRTREIHKGEPPK